MSESCMITYVIRFESGQVFFTAMSRMKPKPEIWWSNIAFFLGVHLAALTGVYYRPVSTQSSAILYLAFLSWILSCFGSAIHTYQCGC